MPRSKPFSGKQKKLQLQTKRQTKKDRAEGQFGGAVSHTRRRPTFDSCSSESDESLTSSVDQLSFAAEKICRKLKSANPKSRDRYKLLLKDESQEEILEKKKRAMQPYSPKSPQEMECGVGQFYDPPIMFPVRPPWDYSLSPEELDNREYFYFRRYCKEIISNEGLSYCELNLETWRQLWRVLEMSDILLHIVDVRYTPLHFNPKLYEYVTHELQKQLIVVLNKCDIVPADVVTAWKHYLLKEFPKLDVVVFTSFPKDEETRQALAKGKQSRRRRKKSSAIGPLELWNVCNKLVKQEVNIDSWRDKIQKDLTSKYGRRESDSDQSDCEVEEGIERRFKPDLRYSEHSKYKGGVLTIGCVGYPNVGKSSVINGLIGRKVVSISKTPGHTKHFQTIFLTKNVKLCDCPGLVFPSTAPRPIQVLAGMYPVAQLREPYSVVQYLAERCDLPACLGLRLPEDEKEWSAYLICDELAELKGFKTARGARTNPHRAANWILRASLEGKMFIYLIPPDYCENKKKWEDDPETLSLIESQKCRLATVSSQYDYQSLVSFPDDDDSSSEENFSSAAVNPFSSLKSC